MYMYVLSIFYVPVPHQILYTIDRLQAVSDTLTAATSLASESGGEGLMDHGRSQSPDEAVSLVSYPLFSPTPGGEKLYA